MHIFENRGLGAQLTTVQHTGPQPVQPIPPLCGSDHKHRPAPHTAPHGGHAGGGPEPGLLTEGEISGGDRGPHATGWGSREPGTATSRSWRWRTHNVAHQGTGDGVLEDVPPSHMAVMRDKRAAGVASHHITALDGGTTHGPPPQHIAPPAPRVSSPTLKRYDQGKHPLDQAPCCLYFFLCPRPRAYLHSGRSS